MLYTENELHFSWNDMEKLNKYRIGLRHLSSKEQLITEAKSYGYGSSLNLTMKLTKNWKETEKKLETDPLLRTKAVQLFESIINRFILDSLLSDARETKVMIYPGQTTLEEVASLVNTCFFSIINYDTNNEPCDFDNWGNGLGKFDPAIFFGFQVTPIGSLNKNELGYPQEKFNEIFTKENAHETSIELYEHMTALYRTKLIKTLRSTSFECADEIEKKYQEMRKLCFPDQKL